ncbi:unnamed protein product [Nippostrongylus brasiliensis]|uniref:Sema domain-containing protein n=1 Tax=Nippostrongylus brasiliensis TaxID=27835 RepID=A0A0N4XLP3_NIPBR|nr:unnamed protein product [Nippostrongylus brasiliensis]
MQRLKLTFWYNIDRCRGGADSIGLPHIGRDSKCINKSRIPLDEETCELGVGGSIEAVEIAVAEVEAKISSLGGVSQPRILLAGTDDGRILQVSRRRYRKKTTPRFFSLRTPEDLRKVSFVKFIFIC